MTEPIPARVAARAHAAHVAGPGGCRLSTYSIGSHGYAQIGWQTAGVLYGTTAHRAAWTHEHGPIPEAATVDHTCRQRRCVNVEHLRLLSNPANARRNAPGRDFPDSDACAYGHPASSLRVVMRSARRGQRRESITCGDCHRIRLARGNWRQRRPGEPLPERLLLGGH